MPPRTRAGAVPPGPAVEEEPQLPTGTVAVEDLEDEPSFSDELQDLYAELGTLDEVRVYISRHNPKTGHLAAIPSMSASEFSVDRLAELYGGGTYTIQVKQGRKSLKKKRVEIDGTVKGTVADGVGGVADTARLQQGSAAPSLENIVDQVLARLPAPAAPATPAAPSLKDRLEELKVIADILRPQAVEQHKEPSLKDRLEEMKLLRDMVDDLGGGGPRSEISEWVGVARDLGLPLVNWIKDQVTAAQARGAVPPAVAARVGNAAPPPAAGQPTTGGDPNVPAWLQELGTWIPAMVNDATKGTDPVSFAEYMYARLTPPTQGEVGRFVADPQALDKLLTVVPPLKPHAEWVEEVLATVKEIVEEDGVQPPPPTGEPTGQPPVTHGGLTLEP